MVGCVSCRNTIRYRRETHIRGTAERTRDQWLVDCVRKRNGCSVAVASLLLRVKSTQTSLISYAHSSFVQRSTTPNMAAAMQATPKTISIPTSAGWRAQQRNNTFPAASGQEQLSLQLLGCEYIDVKSGLLRVQIRSSENYFGDASDTQDNLSLRSTARHSAQERLLNSISAESS
jgi:hypothetical protein